MKFTKNDSYSLIAALSISQSLIVHIALIRRDYSKSNQKHPMKGGIPMTRNQIEYLNYLEQKRHNQQSERVASQQQAETIRSNLARETETRRHNLVSQAEIKRSNLAKEYEANRANLANEAIKSEANQISWGNLAETRRSNAAREAETVRSNLAYEHIGRLNAAANQVAAAASVFNAQANLQNAETNAINAQTRKEELAETIKQNARENDLRKLDINEKYRHNTASEKLDAWRIGVDVFGTAAKSATAMFRVVK